MKETGEILIQEVSPSEIDYGPKHVNGALKFVLSVCCMLGTLKKNKKNNLVLAELSHRPAQTTNIRTAEL